MTTTTTSTKNLFYIFHRVLIIQRYVILVPSKIDYITPSITVDRDSNVVLSCSASGTPTPMVKWIYKNTVLQQSSSQVNYTVRVANTSQAGQYACTASNKYGTVTKTTEIVLRRKCLVSYCIASHHVISMHKTSHHIAPHLIISHRITLHRIASHRIA